jgi:hypothetical protein
MTNNLSGKNAIRSLLVGLSLASIIWVIYIIHDSAEEIKISVAGIEYKWLTIVLIGNCISSYIAFEGFRLLFERIHPNTYDRRFLAHLYFIGQLMKHLPGRIFGIAYQASIGDKTSSSQWVGINAAYMLLTTAFAIFVACSVAAIMFNVAFGIAAIFVGISIYFMCWQPSTLQKIEKFVPSSKMVFVKNAIQPIITIASANRTFQFKVLVIFLTSWVIYLISWMWYGIAWPSLTALDGIRLCGIYTLAWFFGYISFVSPSGLGVREAAFFLLAKDFPPDAIAGMALLGRVTLLLVDIILGLIYLYAGNGSNARTQ